MATAANTPSLVLRSKQNSSIVFAIKSWLPSRMPTAMDPTIITLIKAAAWALHPTQNKDNFEVVTSTEFVDTNWQITSTVLLCDPYTIIWKASLLIGNRADGKSAGSNVPGLSQPRAKYGKDAHAEQQTKNSVDWLQLADARIKILYVTLSALEIKVSDRMNSIASTDPTADGSTTQDPAGETLPLYEELF